MRILCLIIIALLTQFQVCYSQCASNLIKNGSFELDSVGENITGMFWEQIEGTPDIEDASDLDTPYGATYDSGKPQMSCDGGNWQLIGASFANASGQPTFESIEQTIELTNSVPHQLSFEYCSKAIFSGSEERQYGAIDVFINDELIYTTDLDTTLYSFEKVSTTFTPNIQNITLKFRVSEIVNPISIKVMGIDGVCLRPIVTGFFCEP